MPKLNKKILLIAGVVLVVLITGIYLFARSKSSSEKTNDEIQPTEEVIPTVDSSVKVDLKAQNGKKEVLLSVSNMPQGTKTLEYEISYETQSQGSQGVTASPVDLKGKRSYEKTITLGTCSSGTCVYHQIVGPVQLLVKFNGTYGVRVFQKDYDL